MADPPKKPSAAHCCGLLSPPRCHVGRRRLQSRSRRRGALGRAGAGAGTPTPAGGAERAGAPRQPRRCFCTGQRYCLQEGKADRGNSPPVRALPKNYCLLVCFSVFPSNLIQYPSFLVFFFSSHTDMYFYFSRPIYDLLM